MCYFERLLRAAVRRIVRGAEKAITRASASGTPHTVREPRSPIHDRQRRITPNSDVTQQIRKLWLHPERFEQRIAFEER